MLQRDKLIQLRERAVCYSIDKNDNHIDGDYDGTFDLDVYDIAFLLLSENFGDPTAPPLPPQ